MGNIWCEKEFKVVLLFYFEDDNRPCFNNWKYIVPMHLIRHPCILFSDYSTLAQLVSIVLFYFPPQTKLDFGSPKPPRREVLEEEASIDFVFIPPETKERVLTEHQKEVKRTKRSDLSLHITIKQM